MSDLELQPGERILRDATARSIQPPRQIGKPLRFSWKNLGWGTDGHLYLTNRRVVWQRRWFSLPFIPVTPFEIRLEDIRNCEVVGGGLAHVFGSGALYIVTEHEKHRLLVADLLWFSVEVAEDWREDILNAATPHTS